MSTVAILGAGDLGAATARALARSDRVARVVLIDPSGAVAAGKALDIQQTGPIEGFHTEVSASADEGAAAEAVVTIVADLAGATSNDHQGDAGVSLLQRVFRTNTRGVVICAGASQLLLIERSVRDLKTPPARLFGSAPEALTAAARQLVALEVDAHAADVVLTLLGAPPKGWVVAWTDARIGGRPAVDVLSPLQMQRVTARIERLWPPGPYALAAAAAATCRAVVAESRRLCSCFAVLDAWGSGVRVAAAPVRVGRNGIVSIHVPALSPHEQTAFGLGR